MMQYFYIAISIAFGSILVSRNEMRQTQDKTKKIYIKKTISEP